MKWTEKIKVNSHSEDYNEVVRPSDVMSYLQEAANLQIHTFGPTYQDLLKENRIFVVSRFAVNFIEPIHKYEELESETWSVESTGYSFSRFHRLYRNGVKVCEAESIWALVDIETYRPCRATEFKPNYEQDERIDIGMPIRMKLPQTGEMEYLGDHRVSYYETDLNHHMNNTKYADLLCDYIDMDGRRVQKVLISYLNQAPLHETIKIYRNVVDQNTVGFRTLRTDGKTNIEATITTTKL